MEGIELLEKGEMYEREKNVILILLLMCNYKNIYFECIQITGIVKSVFGRIFRPNQKENYVS